MLGLCVYLLHFLCICVVGGVVCAADRSDWRGKWSLMITEQSGYRTMGLCCNGPSVICCPFVNH